MIEQSSSNPHAKKYTEIRNKQSGDKEKKSTDAQCPHPHADSLARSVLAQCILEWMPWFSHYVVNAVCIRDAWKRCTGGGSVRCLSVGCHKTWSFGTSKPMLVNFLAAVGEHGLQNDDRQRGIPRVDNWYAVIIVFPTYFIDDRLATAYAGDWMENGWAAFWCRRR